MGTQTSMTIGTFKMVACKMSSQTSVLLRANHGVGKSKIVRQVSAMVRNAYIAIAKAGGNVTTPDGTVVEMSQFTKAIEAKSFFQVIDRRLSQMTEGDMVGLPSTDGEVTRFNPPDWFKRACTEPCVLFLDELNRATPEVMQAAFQIVLDRELNGWKLHPLTRVYAAVNCGAAYTVNEMDPALLDRFFVIDLQPEVKEFCAWARSTDPEQGGNLHWSIPEFIEDKARANGDSWLFPSKGAEAGTVQPSPRSWEAVNRELVHAGVIESPNDPLFYHLCIGFVGVEAAISFKEFCSNIDSRLSGDEIVNDFDNEKVKRKVGRLTQDRQNDMIDRVTDYCLKNLEEVTEKQGRNIKEFMLTLPDELKISLWSKLASKGSEKLKFVKSVHKHVVRDVLQVFGMKPGQEGVGMTPNIPGIFKQQQK